MHNLIEDYCKVCSDNFDPLLGCRCQLVNSRQRQHEHGYLLVHGGTPFSLSPVGRIRLKFA